MEQFQILPRTVFYHHLKAGLVQNVELGGGAIQRANLPATSVHGEGVLRHTQLSAEENSLG